MTNIMLHNGELTYAEVLGDRFAEQVQTTINFAFNSAALDEQARAILREQAAFIRHFPEVRFTVYGHTDLVGSRAYNHRLGLRRARAAMHYIISQGVDRSRLQALVSRGESDPVVATEMEERRNRRTVTEVTGFVQSIRWCWTANTPVSSIAPMPGRAPSKPRTNTSHTKKGPPRGPFFFARRRCPAGKYPWSVNVIPLFGPIVALFYGQFRLRSDPCGALDC
jgi:hypothetical protein